jgi:hypothetical protein
MTRDEKLENALKKIIELEGTESDEWDGMERVIPEMVKIARQALEEEGEEHET